MVEMFPIDSAPFGFTFAEWTMRWWNWLLSIPKTQNPALDLEGSTGHLGQTDKSVWFLAGTANDIHAATRFCVIPFGKAVFFPILTTVISFAEYPSVKTTDVLVSNASKDISKTSHLEVILDGISLQHLYDYRVKSGPFDLYYPENNLFGTTQGMSKAASDGFWLFLKPFAPGRHTIFFHGIEPNFSSKVQYTVNVK
jgi:hypothetical protein